MTFRIRKIEVSISVLFFALAAWYLSASLGENYLCALLFSSLHEFGHLIPMRLFRCEVQRLHIGMAGIKIEKKNTGLSYKQECMTALGGPTVNLLFALLFFMLLHYDESFVVPFAVNTGLMLINLLPVKSLDGGRFLHSFLLMKTDMHKADAILQKTETITILFLAVIMVASVALEKTNTSFVFFCIALCALIVRDLRGKGRADC